MKCRFLVSVGTTCMWFTDTHEHICRWNISWLLLLASIVNSYWTGSYKNYHKVIFFVLFFCTEGTVVCPSANGELCVLANPLLSAMSMVIQFYKGDGIPIQDKVGSQATLSAMLAFLKLARYQAWHHSFWSLEPSLWKENQVVPWYTSLLQKQKKRSSGTRVSFDLLCHTLH